VVVGASTLTHGQTPAVCLVTGTITDRGHALSGVAVTLTDADGTIADVSSSSPDGTFELKARADGRYTIAADLIAFAPATREVIVDAGVCPVRADVSMTLASRASPRTPASAPIPASRQSIVTATAAGRSRRGGAPQPFQNLPLVADQSAAGRADDAENPTPENLVPPGFSPDASADAVATIGNAQTNAAFFGGPGGPDAFAQRFGFGAPDAAPQGRGGPNGAFGGGGGPFIGRGRGGQIRGNLFDGIDSSALDTSPYSLTGQPATKPDYFQQRFGATVGGPMRIPGLFDRAHDFFFLNYTGNHSRNPYSAYATVPTAAERAGDLSALGRTIVDPATAQPLPGAQIPAAALNPTAAQLLRFIPLPNEPGLTKNLHTLTTTTNQLDDVNVRFVHTFGEVPQRGRQGGAGRGGFGGGRGGRSASSNLNVQIHVRRSETTNANPFETLNGDTTLTAWDVPVSFSFTKAGMVNTLRADVNHQRAQTQNAFAGIQNVAGDAGLLGVSTDPFDWGVPALSFTSFTSLRQGGPSEQTNRTIAVGDTVTKIRGAHAIRFGGDYRDIRSDSRTDANANGSFVFTGLYTGLDFADFLLGFPQQATVQFGPGLERFRSRSADLFVQDDWRIDAAVTLNLGLRYEVYSPVSEAADRLATLDTSAGFTAAVPVLAGGTGPFSGVLPDSIVRPFRRGLAPRVGVAWRARADTIVRAGYGINYNASVYPAIALQLAAQPPFADTDTVLATASSSVALQTALLSATAATTNTYGVDPNYRLPFVQIYNADLQRNLTRTVTLDVAYTGTKGTNLDLVSAPDRNPDGTLRIAGVQPFLWESSTGRSLMNAVTVSLRKRQSRGLAAAASYTLSKSMDNASSIGGGGTVVAQDPRNLDAEWGPSSFDQRHRLSGSATYDLPFGANRRWLTGGRSAALVSNWQVMGSVQLASGTPFTARVLGNVHDVGTGLNGTLRANYSGEPIAVADSTVARFFDTAAFSVPAAGTYGDAGRNSIVGPGVSNVNVAITRSIPLGETRTLSIQLLANNLFDTVQFASIDTIVNSPTFGQVTAARPMRTVQLIARFRF
jgi:hypothetical protein